eukprot:gene28023-34660_t
MDGEIDAVEVPSTLLAKPGCGLPESTSVKPATQGSFTDALLESIAIFEKEKNKRRHFREWDLTHVDPWALLGRNVRLWWPEDEVWYSGEVGDYDPATRKHTVNYLDGDSENLYLGSERVRVDTAAGELLPTAEASLCNSAEGQAVEAPSSAAAKEQPRMEALPPEQYVGCTVQVFWPLDKAWYGGQVTGWNGEKHQVLYDDGVKENLLLSKERIKLWASDGKQVAPPPLQDSPAQLATLVQVSVAAADPRDLVGRTVHIYWEDDDKFYPGKITSFNTKSRKHKARSGNLAPQALVQYDDGDEEDLVLAKETLKLDTADGSVDRWLSEDESTKA